MSADPDAYADCPSCGMSALACYGETWDGKRCCSRCVHRAKSDVSGERKRVNALPNASLVLLSDAKGQR